MLYCFLNPTQYLQLKVHSVQVGHTGYDFASLLLVPIILIVLLC